MVAIKHIKKETISFCSEVSDLLLKLKINETNEENIKKYENLYKQSENCKNLINDKGSNKNNSNYNNYIRDCFLIKKGEKTSGILPKDIEEELSTDIKKHNGNNYFSLFANFWKNKINEDIKNKYKNKKDQEDKDVDKKENVKHRGRPKKIING